MIERMTINNGVRGGGGKMKKKGKVRRKKGERKKKQEGASVINHSSKLFSYIAHYWAWLAL